MNPALVELLIQVLLKYGPGVAQGISNILHKADPAPADWDAVFTLAETPYEDYINPPVRDGYPPANITARANA